MWTFVVLLSLLVSGGFVNSAVARQADDQTITQPNDEPGRPRNRQTVRPALSAAKKDGLISYREPSEAVVNALARARLGANASQQQIEAAGKQVLAEWRQKNYHGPDPDANQKLLRNEQRSLAANSSPAAMGTAVTGTLRLFAVAVEFAGTDTITQPFSHPKSVEDRTCVTEPAGTQFSGPLHNQIPPPGPRDNFSLWKPSFERDYYEKTLFSTEGITERVRPDLTDPEDGKPGIDLSGQTMRNYYTEVSSGRVRFDGGPKGVIAWIQVPHSQAYYGASRCINGQALDLADMSGLPSNPSFPNGPQQLVKDIVAQINAADPTFPWKDYDTNGDGILDHVVIFHAGKDKSAGGGQQGYQALWAHRGNVDAAAGGYAVSNNGTPNNPADDIRVSGYTMQYEDVETGVLAHEFGHDLGLPDLYDTSRAGENSVVWWDLMSTGSNSGKLIGANPTNMSAWSKFALGWADPKVITPSATAQEVTLGQTSNPPPGTQQAIRVNLPATPITYTTLLTGSTQAWWSNKDANWADVRLVRDLDLTGRTGAISISFDLDSITEEDWDYLFLEASADGGQTYTQLKGFEVSTNVELTTPDNYPDPNGRLRDYGGLKYGYTGDISAKAQNPIGGWVRAYHDLSPYAGKNIKLRFRYATDAAFLERGAFIDNIKITAGRTVLLNDPVEGNNPNGWTNEVRSFVSGEPLSAGWKFSTGVEVYPLYYLAEWRNFNGFDRGLKYTYNTILAELTPDGRDEFRVDLVPSNVPGMVVYVRDTRFGNEPFGADNTILDPNNQFTATPSEGPKGGLLVVDANADPLRGPRNGSLDTGYGTFPFPPFNNWSARVQTTNAAFNMQGTPPITLTFATGTATPTTTIYTPTLYTSLPGVPGFHDSLGYYPGVEKLPEPVTTFSSTTVLRIKPYAFSDPDASVVVPAKGYYPPRTPAGFTGRGGETSPPSANVSTFETIYNYLGTLFPISIGEAGGTDVTGQRSGNPGSDSLQYGNHFVVTNQAQDGSSGTVRIYNAQYDAQVKGSIQPGGAFADPVTIMASAQNTGSPRALVLYSDFDERQATYVDGSATNGAIPVTADQPLVEELVRTKGMAGLQSVRAQQASEVKAVVWFSPGALDSGEQASFTYKLTRKPGAFALRVTTYALGQGFSSQDVSSIGRQLFLPQIANSK